MNKSDYIRRAIAELTGRPVKDMPIKIKVPGMYLLLGGAGLLLALILLVVLWPRGSSPETASLTGNDMACAFRITRRGAPVPETQGDSAQLDTCVKLEVVDDNTTRTLGLSGRQSMAWDQGMLFDFEQTGEYCMWMKDMRFSLDILWVDESSTIVGMREGVSPATYPKAFCGPKAARYVIEVNDGVVRAGDLHVGQRLNLPL